MAAWLLGLKGHGDTPARAGQARAVAAIRHCLRGPRRQPEITRGLRSAVRDRAHETLPPPRDDRLFDDPQLAGLLARAAAEEELAGAAPKRRHAPDGRSKRATHQRWLREHVPLVYLGLYGAGDELARTAEHRRRRELEELARVRRDALAFCVDCHHPLVATEHGSQFYPYERAGQHAKVSRARDPHQVMAGRARAHNAARDTAGRFAPKPELAALGRVAVGLLRSAPQSPARSAAGEAALPRPSKAKGETPPLLRIQSS
jgi:hypothetical protein